MKTSKNFEHNLITESIGVGLQPNVLIAFSQLIVPNVKKN